MKQENGDITIERFDRRSFLFCILELRGYVKWKINNKMLYMHFTEFLIVY